MIHSTLRQNTIKSVPRITQEFLPVVSGPANQALAISQELEQCGIASPILTTTTGTDTRVEAAGVTVHRFRPSIAATNFRPSAGLVRHLLRERATLFHIHGWRNPVSDGAIIAARRRRIPLVVQAHGVAFGHRYTYESPLLRIARHVYDQAIKRLVTQSAAAVVASTRQEADELRAYGFPADRIVVIPCGVAANFFHEAPARPAKRDHMTILAVGRLSTRRNVEQIIQALALLRTWGVNAQLRIVGPEVKLTSGDIAGYRRHLERLTQRLGVAAHVSFTGPRHGIALLEEYRLADIFVCTTLYENFGQPIAEAAATGLPIVATPTGIAPDLLEDGAAGILVPFRDPVATATALQRLWSKPDLRRRMGQATRQRAADTLDWQRIVPHYLELYATILESHKQR